MSGDLCFNLGNAYKRLIPARLQFACDQSVCRIGRVELAEGSVCRVARGLQITRKSITDLIVPVARRDVRCRYNPRLDYLLR